MGTATGDLPDDGHGRRRAPDDLLGDVADEQSVRETPAVAPDDDDVEPRSR